MTRRISSPHVVTTIVKALVRVFKKPKAIASDGIPEGEKKKRKKSRALSVMPKSRKRRDARGNVCIYVHRDDSLVADQPGSPKSKCSPTSFSSKYLIAIDSRLSAIHRDPGNGTDSRT